MDIQVKIYKSNDHSFVSLVDKYSIPVCPYAAVYNNTSLSGFQFNTKLRYLYELKFVLTYFASKNIDLVERVKTGELILNAELNSFINNSKFCQASDFSDAVEIQKFTSKQLQNAIHSARVTDARVKANVSKGRITRLAHYIDFLFDEIHSDQSVPADVLERKHTIQRKCNAAIRGLKDFNQECRDLNESPLPNMKLVELLEIIKPESARNPFKHSRLRNNLIFKLITETGIRRGAAAKLKISDCKFHGSYDQINITRTPNDPTDARTIKAQQKTKPHPAFITPDTLRHIKHYIDTTRGEFAKSAKHDFIFVTEMNSKGTAGLPLSLNSVNSIFRKLSGVIGMRVHPHLLRHKWNEMFDEFATEKGMTYEQIEDLRKYAMGWSEKSEMGALYNEYKLYLKVRELEKARQDAITNKGGKERTYA